MVQPYPLRRRTRSGIDGIDLVRCYSAAAALLRDLGPPVDLDGRFVTEADTASMHRCPVYTRDRIIWCQCAPGRCDQRAVDEAHKFHAGLIGGLKEAGL
jgi:hypothetical protein